MKPAERPEPEAAISDVVVEVHASRFVPTELDGPSTWTDRVYRGRTPSIPGHELAGVATALGYGTTGLSVGRRVYGLPHLNRSDRACGDCRYALDGGGADGRTPSGSAGASLCPQYHAGG
jgi:D-arabinose 1-dehydrogenase-like Zn-dependent alcohol dehydrogenase